MSLSQEADVKMEPSSKMIRMKVEEGGKKVNLSKKRNHERENDGSKYWVPVFPQLRALWRSFVSSGMTLARMLAKLLGN